MTNDESKSTPAVENRDDDGVVLCHPTPEMAADSGVDTPPAGNAAEDSDRINDEHTGDGETIPGGFTPLPDDGRQWLQPSLEHRDTADFKEAVRIVKAAEGRINRPETCPVTAIASMCLVPHAMDVIEGKSRNLDELSTALQEMGAWQVLMVGYAPTVWWKMARRLKDPYARSAAIASAIFMTKPYFTTEKIMKRITSIGDVDFNVEVLDGALVTLAMRENHTLEIAKKAAMASATALMDMYNMAQRVHRAKVEGELYSVKPTMKDALYATPAVLRPEWE